MTVDFIFEFLSSLLDGFISSNSLLIISMLVPCLAIFGFITVYALVVIYAELKVSSFIQDNNFVDLFNKSLGFLPLLTFLKRYFIQKKDKFKSLSGVF